MASPPELKKEHLDIIPTFNGNTKVLKRFIETSEKLIARYYNRTNLADFQNTYVIDSIINKVTGTAADQLLCYNITTWESLKTALKQIYTDKRDDVTLLIEILDCKQDKLSAMEYYNKFTNLIELYSTYIELNYDAVHTIVLKENVGKIALRVFTQNLREPTGNFIRVRNPATLGEAYNLLMNEFNSPISKTPFTFTQNRPTQLAQRLNLRPQQFIQSQPYQTYKPQPMETQPSPQAHFQKPFQTTQFRKPFQPAYQPQKRPIPMTTSTRHSPVAKKLPYRPNYLVEQDDDPDENFDYHPYPREPLTQDPIDTEELEQTTEQLTLEQDDPNHNHFLEDTSLKLLENS